MGTRSIKGLVISRGKQGFIDSHLNSYLENWNLSFTWTIFIHICQVLPASPNTGSIVPSVLFLFCFKFCFKFRSVSIKPSQKLEQFPVFWLISCKNRSNETETKRIGLMNLFLACQLVQICIWQTFWNEKFSFTLKPLKIFFRIGSRNFMRLQNWPLCSSYLQPRQSIAWRYTKVDGAERRTEIDHPNRRQWWWRIVCYLLYEEPVRQSVCLPFRCRMRQKGKRRRAEMEWRRRRNESGNKREKAALQMQS